MCAGTTRAAGKECRNSPTVSPGRCRTKVRLIWQSPIPAPSPASVSFPLRGDVRFNQVVFGYTPEKTILNGISLYAKPGQKIAFVGSTGAGKTTLINLVNRFYEIQQGTITYDGIDIRTIKRTICAVPSPW